MRDVAAVGEVAPVGNDWFQLERSTSARMGKPAVCCTSRKRLVSVGAQRAGKRSGIQGSLVAPVGNDWFQLELPRPGSDHLVHRPVAPVGNDWFQLEHGRPGRPVPLWVVAPVGNDWFQLELAPHLVAQPLQEGCTSRKRLVSVGAALGAVVACKGMELHQSETTGFSWSHQAAFECPGPYLVAPVGNDWFQLEPEKTPRLPAADVLLHQSETTGFSWSHAQAGDPLHGRGCTSRKRLVSVGAPAIRTTGLPP